MAVLKISDLVAGTPPYPLDTLLEASVPSGGSWVSRKIELGDVAAAVGDGLTLNNATLTGTTTLEGGGQITAGGWIGIGMPAQHHLSIGPTAAAARIYNSFTDAANNEFAYLGEWASSVARYGTDRNGTGVARDVSIMRGGVEQIRLGATGPVLTDLSVSTLKVTTGHTINRLLYSSTAGAVLTDDYLFVNAGATAPSLGVGGVAAATDRFRLFSPATVNSGLGTDTLMEISALRVGSVFWNAGIYFSVPRSDTADGGTVPRRSYILATGNSASTTSSIFIGANTAGSVLTGDAAAIRANQGVLELTHTGNFSIWRASVESIRLTGSTVAGFFNGGGVYGFKNANPVHDIDIGNGVAGGRLRTRNLYTDNSNGEWCALGDWGVTANLAVIGTQMNGTGIARDVSLTRGGVEMAKLSAYGLEKNGRVWATRVNPVDNNWQNVQYGNGLYVAVANSGTNRLMTSPDGVNWTARASALETNNWFGITYGKGLFVAVSNSGTAGQRVMTSPDGINWTIRSTPTPDGDINWVNVAFGNGVFVAVANTGGANSIMTSPDGITWTMQVASDSNTHRGIAFGNGLFVVIANTGTGDRVMTSPDGVTWTTRTSAADNGWVNVCYGNGLFVAVSTTGTNRVMTSPDGITWTSRSTITGTWINVAYGDGLFAAVANTGTGRIAISPDGIEWTQRVAPVDANNWAGITFGNGVFVAVSNTGTANRIMTSGAQIMPNFGLGGA